MADENAAFVRSLTPEQIELLKPLLERPERMAMLVNFIDNMLAAKQVSKIIAWAFGVFLAGLAAWFYFTSIFSVKPMHGVP